MNLRRRLAAHPLAAAFLFEGALIPLALLLAVGLGVRPWAAFGISGEWLLGAILATLPLVGFLALFSALRPAWFDEIERLVHPMIGAMFRGRGIPAVLLASVLAGLGEELLFRGVLQAWLVGPIGAWPAVVLAGVIFGLVHSVTRAYFLLATCMGLYLGALYQLTGNLLMPSLAHALYDAIAIVYLLRSAGPPPRAA